MHALEWIDQHGRFRRTITATALRKALGRTKNRCTWCDGQTPLRRRTWCSAECWLAYQARKPSYARDAAYERDRGVCQLCGRDTVRMLALLRRLEEQASENPHGGWLSVLAAYKTHLIAQGFHGLRRVCVTSVLAEGDHIVPVCEGGGLCGPAGYRTVCVPCHAQLTRELNQQRAAVRRSRKRMRKRPRSADE